MGCILRKIPLHRKYLIQSLGHLIKRIGQLLYFAAAAGDGDRLGQILCCPGTDLSGQIIQRGERFPYQRLNQKRPD